MTQPASTSDPSRICKILQKNPNTSCCPGPTTFHASVCPPHSPDSFCNYFRVPPTFCRLRQYYHQDEDMRFLSEFIKYRVIFSKYYTDLRASLLPVIDVRQKRIDGNESIYGKTQKFPRVQVVFTTQIIPPHSLQTIVRFDSSQNKKEQDLAFINPVGIFHVGRASATQGQQYTARTHIPSFHRHRLTRFTTTEVSGTSCDVLPFCRVSNVSSM